MAHTTVLLNEAVDALVPRRVPTQAPDGTYVDAHLRPRRALAPDPVALGAAGAADCLRQRPADAIAAASADR